MSLFKKKKMNPQKIGYEEGKKRVLRLHETADFLMYIDDAYMREPYGQVVTGVVAIGKSDLSPRFNVYSSEGIYVTSINIHDAYIKDNQVTTLEAGDKKVYFYPDEKNDKLIGGQLLILGGDHATDK